MRQPREIHTSTTETIPGIDYVADGGMVTWSSGATIAKAIEGLQAWAAGNGFDAVVGIRMEVLTDVTQKFGSAAGVVETNPTWVVYGTAILFKS
jgi:hypothetical protein